MVTFNFHLVWKNIDLQSHSKKALKMKMNEMDITSTTIESLKLHEDSVKKQCEFEMR